MVSRAVSGGHGSFVLSLAGCCILSAIVLFFPYFTTEPTHSHWKSGSSEQSTKESLFFCQKMVLCKQSTQEIFWGTWADRFPEKTYKSGVVWGVQWVWWIGLSIKNKTFLVKMVCRYKVQICSLRTLTHSRWNGRPDDARLFSLSDHHVIFSDVALWKPSRE